MLFIRRADENIEHKMQRYSGGAACGTMRLGCRMDVKTGTVVRLATETLVTESLQ